MSKITDRSVEGLSDRRDRLSGIVESRGFCTISELAQILEVSEMTVRRDVAKLVAQGGLEALHGGVRAPGRQNFLGTDYAIRAEFNRDVKLWLAERALELAEPLSVIGIDTGTTGVALAQLIPTSWRGRVVTSSLPVVAALNRHKDVEVTVLGGVLHVETQSIFGVSTAAAAREVHLETFFMTASAASERGLYCTYELGAAVRRSFMDSADRVVLISDSSKFREGSMTRICGWDKVDAIVIDDRLDDSTASFLEMQGVEVIMVPCGDVERSHVSSA